MTHEILLFFSKQNFESKMPSTYCSAGSVPQNAGHMRTSEKKESNSFNINDNDNRYNFLFTVSILFHTLEP